MKTLLKHLFVIICILYWLIPYQYETKAGGNGAGRACVSGQYLDIKGIEKSIIKIDGYKKVIVMGYYPLNKKEYDVCIKE